MKIVRGELKIFAPLERGHDWRTWTLLAATAAHSRCVSGQSTTKFSVRTRSWAGEGSWTPTLRLIFSSRMVKDAEPFLVGDPVHSMLTWLRFGRRWTLNGGVSFSLEGKAADKMYVSGGRYASHNGVTRMRMLMKEFVSRVGKQYLTVALYCSTRDRARSCGWKRRWGEHRLLEWEGAEAWRILMCRNEGCIDGDGDGDARGRNVEMGEGRWPVK